MSKLTKAFASLFEPLLCKISPRYARYKYEKLGNELVKGFEEGLNKYQEELARSINEMAETLRKILDEANLNE